MMKKIILFLTVIFMSLSGVQTLFAQTVGKGHEIAKGVLDFTATAKYLLAHPTPPVMQAIENDEDDDERPVRTTAVDSSKLAIRHPSKYFSFSPSPSLPASPLPTDTFEAVLDLGTNIPPDTHGAVDANYCMTATNSQVKIQTRSGGPVSAVTLNAFWASVTSGGTFDPRVHYDPYTNRWIVVAVCDAALSTSSILIAVSQTNDPTGLWWMYKILADGTGVNWLDFPDVGFNGKWITVTGNFFTNSTNTFVAADVFVFDKANLLSGASATYTSFLQPGDFTICPALTYNATTGNMFLVDSYNGTNFGGGVMQLWKISGAVGSESMTSVSFPQATGFNWQQNSFAATGPTPGADFAPQSGTSNLIQTNDDRLDQVVFMNNTLWFAHTIFVPYSGSVNPTRSSVQWWQIDTFGNPIQIGTIDDPTNTNFYAFPTMTPNGTDDALVGFSTFSATTHPSAAYSLRMHTDPADSMRPIQVYRHGQNTYFKKFSGSKDRWGDYSAACIDPVNMTDFWTVQEASANPANTWDTWWAHVKLCSPPAAVSGITPVCVGASVTVSDDSVGGNWTSGATTIATVGATTGIITGVSGGTASITYTIPGGCIAVTTATINPLPGAISGTTGVCTGLTTTLNDAGGGTWTSGTSSVATVIAGTGLVTGIAPGTSIITYTLPVTGCSRTTTVTVSTSPGAITGNPAVCTGATTSLTDAGGGTWTSGGTLIATVGSVSGVVTGVSAGTAVITYTLAAGCNTNTTVTVTTTPVAITGTKTVCAGAATILSDATAGGVWSSGNTAIATVLGGTVTGVTAGTVTISYTMGASCSATAVVTVNPMPSAITGTGTVCAGLTTLLSDGVSGGVWSSANTSIATVSAGTVTGVSAGTAVISYTLGASCSVTTVVTVNLSPAAITGTPTVCIGLTTALSDATLGGAWTSANTAIADVGAGTGIISGMAGGVTSIVYTLGDGCSATSLVTVTTSAPPITGTASVCVGLTTNLSDISGGGTWSSSNTSVATAGLSTGIISGVTTGTATITYTLGTSCSSTTTVTVNLSAMPITGTTTVCNGATTTLSDASLGGVWSSGNTSIATVGAGSGVVTGASVGTTTITYNIGVACSATTIVTVKSSPSAISGSTNVCIGSSITLSDAGGGTWSSSNTAIASVGVSSGIVTGNTVGAATIRYTLAGCSAASIISVDPLPAINTVTGGGSFCAGGAGTHIGLSGSTAGINYKLFNGSSLVTSLPGTSLPLDYGLITVAGTYTIVAVDATTGCSNSMTGSAVVTVTALETPSVSITAVPGDTICTGGSITLTAVPVFGGTGPTYQWTKNSVVSGTGSSYTPIGAPNDGDTIICVMTSDYACLTTSIAVSNPLIIHVEVPTVNRDSIRVTQAKIASGQVDTFIVFAPFAGTAPSFQWYLNGAPIPGATSATYITTSLADGDKVKCQVTSSNVCATPNVNFSNTIKVQVTTGITNQVIAGNLTLIPNPNKGEFTISGSLTNTANEQVSISVTNVLGQAIYKATALAHNGEINEHIKLPATITGGIYLVKITPGGNQGVFRIVVDK
jgi:uncharacterized protein YjdB